MRKRCYIGDANDAKTNGMQCAYRRLSTGTGTSHLHCNPPDTVLLCSLGSLGCGNLCSKRRTFARPLEPCSTSTGPAQSFALGVGNGNNGIVKRRVDVSDRIRYFSLYFLTRLCFSLCSRHSIALLLHLSSGSLAGTGIGFGTLTAHRQPAPVSYAAVAS